MDNYSMTEKFWLKEALKDFRDRKSMFMHPKDLLIIDTLLGKLTISEKTDRAVVEMRIRYER